MSKQTRWRRSADRKALARNRLGILWTVPDEPLSAERLAAMERSRKRKLARKEAEDALKAKLGIPEHMRLRTILQAQEASTSHRKAKVTLPKLKFLEDAAQ